MIRLCRRRGVEIQEQGRCLAPLGSQALLEPLGGLTLEIPGASEISWE